MCIREYFLSTVLVLGVSCTALAQQPTQGITLSAAKAAKLEMLATDFGNLQRYAAENAMLAKRKRRKLTILMGDSITEQWLKLDSGFFTKNPGLVNRGISGQTGRQMLVRFRQDVLDLRPKRVVILCGTNDVAGNTGSESDSEILGHIKSMAELALANHIQVSICSILPASAFRWKPELKPATRIKQLNAKLGEYCANKGLPYINYYPMLADEAGGLPEKYSNDGVHPNVRGYSVMEKILLQSLHNKHHSR